MNEKISVHGSSGEVIVYDDPDGNVRVEAVIRDDRALQARTFRHLCWISNQVQVRNQYLITDEGHVVLDVIQRYARLWRLLREYDEDQLLAVPERASIPIAELNIAAVRVVI